jgi:hypothetical protein
MNSVKKISLWALTLLVLVGTLGPARYSHAASYVVTESERVVTESPPAVVHTYTPPPVVVHEYTAPPVVVREYAPPVEVREYTPAPVVREETIVTKPAGERENRLHAWWERHFREDRD